MTTTKTTPSEPTGQSPIEWCRCDEFPKEMCDWWPACVDLNGRMWGTEDKFQKFRKSKKGKKDG